MEFIDTAAGDVYAVGAVLFELLTGERFGRGSPAPGRHQTRLEDGVQRLWLALSESNDAHGTEARPVEMRQRVVDLVASMLQYEPEARPSVREVERTCAEIRYAAGGRMLRDWAESVVPELVAEAHAPERADLPPEDGDLTGSILTEKPKDGAGGASTHWVATSLPGAEAEARPQPEARPVSRPPAPTQPTMDMARPAAQKSGGGRTRLLVAAGLFVALIAVVAVGAGAILATQFFSDDGADAATATQALPEAPPEATTIKDASQGELQQQAPGSRTVEPGTDGTVDAGAAEVVDWADAAPQQAPAPPPARRRHRRSRRPPRRRPRRARCA